jgi:hypothetical protein
MRDAMTRQPAEYRLDEEWRGRIKACLTKDGISLPCDQFERFVRNIEGSIAHFFAAAPEGTFRDTHDTLRNLYELSYDDDPPVGLIRGPIRLLPKEAVQYMDGRAPIVWVEEFNAEIRRLASEAETHYAAANRSIKDIDRKIKSIVGAIEDGAYSSTLKERLASLEKEKELALAKIAIAKPKPVLRLHPALPEIYRKKVGALLPR